MTLRALELLALPSPSLILDVGCGSGLSGSILSASPSSLPPSLLHSAPAAAIAGLPHEWIGLDVSPAMLDIALRRETDGAGDLLLADAGQGVPFRPGSFDAAVSISAIQWLCSAATTDARPEERLARFFGTLYAALKRGGRAVCQFYPRDSKQRDMVCRAAIKAGFSAGLMVDDPGTKKEKTYLVLSVGGVVDVASGREEGGDITALVKGMDGVEVVETRKGKIQESGAGSVSGNGLAGRNKELKKGSKAWIVRKKEQMERKGKIVKATSKYTGRKRRPHF